MFGGRYIVNGLFKRLNNLKSERVEVDALLKSKLWRRLVTRSWQTVVGEKEM